MKDNQIVTQLDNALSDYKNAVLDEIKGDVKVAVDEKIKNVADKIQKNFIDKIPDSKLRDASTKTLEKLSSFDDIVKAFKNVEDKPIQVGENEKNPTLNAAMGDIKKFMNGEITRAELMQSLADRAENYISKKVNQVVSTVAIGICGPLADVVGEMAAELACGFFRKAVAPFINAAKKAQMAREKYEQLHEIYEETIRQQEIQRQKFIEKVSAIFGQQKELIEKSLSDLENAFGVNNPEGVTSALNNIASGIGGQELEVKSFGEFKDRIKKRKKLVM